MQSTFVATHFHFLHTFFTRHVDKLDGIMAGLIIQRLIFKRLQHTLSVNNFPHYNLKPKQVQCFEALLLGKDVIAVLPTGFGKSFLFQVLPDLLNQGDGFVIVIVPLNSIIDDQVIKLQSFGISTASLKKPNKNSSLVSLFPEMLKLNHQEIDLGKDEMGDNMVVIPESVVNGDFKILFCHPEALLCKEGRCLLRSSVYQNKLVACVIDEAHCVDTWGKDFRKDYMELGAIRCFFPNAPCMALTATAPAETIDVLKNVMVMKCPFIVRVNPDRPNVYIKKELRGQGVSGFESIILPIANQLKVKRIEYPKTIIYMKLDYCGRAFRFFKNVLKDDQFVEKSSQTRLFEQYHSPATNEMKKSILSEFLKEKSHVRVIFATSAFGMGVNAPDITQIIHISPPSSFEEYVQQFGRAGRNGNPAVASLYYTNGEVSDHIVKQNRIDSRMALFCKNTTNCLREIILSYFDFEFPSREVCCDNCGFDIDNTNAAVERVELYEKISYRQITSTNMEIIRSCFDNILAENDMEDFNFCNLFQNNLNLSEVFQDILLNIEYIKDENTIFHKYEIWDEDLCKKVMEIIKKYSKVL